MKYIKPLSTLVSNQIAAGEVIERPASVVKELFENALDAHATEINIDIGFGGLNKIIVRDNGTGIYPEDLLLAIAPHATSKIQNLQDLNELDSMGFRGEALASIASISRLCIISKTPEAEHATALSWHTDGWKQSPAARAQGTTIEVMDLFYNAPVRKKFLKPERTEFLAIDHIVRRLAMSTPHIRVTLTHNDRKVLVLPEAHTPEQLRQRMQRMLGKKFADAALPIEASYAGMRLDGFISHTGYQRSQNDGLWVYLNRRFIKDKLISHAIKRAYDMWLDPGRFPVCLLYISIPPDTIDVNVHPAKHEVRFHTPQQVHDFIRSEIEKALTLFSHGGEIHDTAPLPCPGTSADTIDPPLAPQQGYMPPPIARSPDLQSLMPPPAPSDSIPRVNASETPNFEQYTINEQFAIIHGQQTSYMIDWHMIRKAWYQDALKALPRPWPARALYVPVRFIPHTRMPADIGERTSVLETFGLSIQWEQDMGTVHRIPERFPQLHLQSFLTVCYTQKDYSPEALLDLFAATAASEPAWMTARDQTALGHFWRTHFKLLKKYPHAILEITPDLCRKLLT